MLLETNQPAYATSALHTAAQVQSPEERSHDGVVRAVERAQQIPAVVEIEFMQRARPGAARPVAHYLAVAPAL